jgi:aspartate carbamoyltransferase regulatory subunit
MRLKQLQRRFDRYSKRGAMPARRIVNMLNVGKIEEGFVLDHIPAGQSMSIYRHLGLDKLDCPVAIIKNARSNKMGKKDILKVECDINTLNLDVLAFINHNITVNVIKDGEIVEKKKLSLPKEIRGVIRCSNPRCITAAEPELPHIFYLADESREIYRCKYCDVKYEENDAEGI